MNLDYRDWLSVTAMQESLIKAILFLQCASVRKIVAIGNQSSMKYNI